MKKILLTITLLLCAIPAFARTTLLYPGKASASSIIQCGRSGASGSTIYTNSMDIGDVSNVGYSYLETSSAATLSGNCTPNVSIVVQQSFQVPATDGTADTAWNTANTTNLATNIKNGVWFHGTLLSSGNTSNAILNPIRYMRFQLQGLAPNATDTTVQLNVSKQFDV